jgi:hypothetical protein
LPVLRTLHALGVSITAAPSLVLRLLLLRALHAALLLSTGLLPTGLPPIGLLAIETGGLPLGTALILAVGALHPVFGPCLAALIPALSVSAPRLGIGRPGNQSRYGQSTQ